MLDLLEGSGPLWTNPALSRLMALPQIARYFEMLVARRAESLGLWTLRACLAELTRGGQRQPVVGEHPSIDLLAVPEGLSGVGHTVPNLTYGRAYTQATSQRFRTPFALGWAGTGGIELIYRMATADTNAAAAIDLDGVAIGTLPFAQRWSRAAYLQR